MFSPNDPRQPFTDFALRRSAQPYSSPTILSGYDLTTYVQGAPLDSDNNTLDTTCYSDGWRCEQRWTTITNIVACAFRD